MEDARTGICRDWRLFCDGSGCYILSGKRKAYILIEIGKGTHNVQK